MTKGMRPRPLADRIWEKVEQTEDCWLWMASRTRDGYARVQGGRQIGVILVHRWMYEEHKGPIPPGLHIDHLCRVRHCVNPNHLEAVTQRENSIRGEAPMMRLYRAGQCSRGHRLIERHYPSGIRRICDECRRERDLQRRQQLRTAAL